MFYFSTPFPVLRLKGAPWLITLPPSSQKMKPFPRVWHKSCFTQLHKLVNSRMTDSVRMPLFSWTCYDEFSVTKSRWAAYQCSEHGSGLETVLYSLSSGRYPQWSLHYFMSKVNSSLKVISCTQVYSIGINISAESFQLKRTWVNGTWTIM